VALTSLDPTAIALGLNEALAVVLSTATSGTGVGKLPPLLSAKTTEPVGVPSLGIELLTVAVKVMAVPIVAGLLDDVRIVVVGTKGTLA
jgi:hypothetical protein